MENENGQHFFINFVHFASCILCCYRRHNIYFICISSPLFILVVLLDEAP
jgi:hypothetical protein